MVYIIAYLFLCLVMGIFGWNRKLGFWGYLFISLLLTPMAGLLMFFASESKHKNKAVVEITPQQRRAMAYGYSTAIDETKSRIQALVDSHRITQEYATAELEPHVQRLEKTLRFGTGGRPTSPLDQILRALENLPAPQQPRAVLSGAEAATPGVPEGEEAESVAADNDQNEDASAGEELVSAPAQPATGTPETDRDAE